MICKEVYSPAELCDLFEVSQLAELLGVCEATARRYQTGQSTPRRGALEYLRLLHFGRAMPDDWPYHFRFVGDRITTGGSTENPLRFAHLEQLNWILGQWYRLLDDVVRLEHEVRVLSLQVPANEAEAAREALTVVAEKIGCREQQLERIRELRRVSS